MIGSLFSGIGGLELGLEWAGLGPVAWQVEIDPFCREVLAKHWPSAVRDVRDVRDAGRRTLPRVDFVVGGFPCQDVSSLGKRRGLDGPRSGLWVEFRRVVEELSPKGVVVENVTSGSPKWLPRVVADLESLGYRVRTLRIAARDVGAPHRRSRIFILGVADTDGEHLREQPRRSGRSDWEGSPEPRGARRRTTQPRLGGGSDGVPAGLDANRWPAGPGTQHAWEPPRTVAPRSLPDRGARLAALGNAVVPQTARIAGLVLREMMGRS